MNENYSIQDWENLIKTSSFSEKEKAEKIYFVRQAYKNNVPVILDLKHFSVLLGLKVGVLTNMVRKPTKFYRRFKIPKRRGGFRDVVTPHKSLLEVQQWICENILNTFKVHEAAHAYVKNKNVAKNATLHIGCDEMLKIDLQNFFPSIGIPRVRELFNRKGYSKEVSAYLSYLCCLDGSIPQGAGSSPMISNIILHTLDNRLSSFSKKYNIIYSRYADDLIFSGQEIPDDFKDLVVLNIEDEGFKINTEKTKEYSIDHRKMITGLLVSETDIRLPKIKRREIQQQVFFLKKYGIMDQVKRCNDIYLIDRLLGRLSYWKQIEPQNNFVLNSIKEIKIMYKNFIKENN